MSDIIYRRAAEHEASLIYQEGYKFFNTSRYPYSMWLLEDVRKLIARPNFAWVAEKDGQIIGFIGAHKLYKGLPEDYGYAEWCFVLPEHRRKGVCSKLVKKVEEDFIKLGKQYIVTDTTRDNVAVQAFLNKEGYQLYAEDLFYRKAILSSSNSNQTNYRKFTPVEQMRNKSFLISAESFIENMLYAIIIAYLLLQFDLSHVSLPSGLIFAGLFITVIRWCHLHVVISKNTEFQNSYGAGLSEFGLFWYSILILVGLFFMVNYQTNLIVVGYTFTIIIFLDLLWEVNLKKHAWRIQSILVLHTVNRWIMLDSVCLVVTIGVLFGIHKFPFWSPWLIFSETLNDLSTFYYFVLSLLFICVSVGDYLDDFLRRIGFYFQRNEA